MNFLDRETSVDTAPQACHVERVYAPTGHLQDSRFDSLTLSRRIADRTNRPDNHHSPKSGEPSDGLKDAKQTEEGPQDGRPKAHGVLECIHFVGKQAEWRGPCCHAERRTFQWSTRSRSPRGLSAGSATTTTEPNNPIAHWHHLCYDSTSIPLYLYCLQVPCRHKDHISANY